MMCFIIKSSDLEEYYTKTIRTVADLSLLRMGVSHEIIIKMIDLIHRIVYRIITLFCDSELSYRGDDIGD